MSLFQHICVCNSGYHGDGRSCVLTDMCKVHNGKCHPKVNFVNSKLMHLQKFIEEGFSNRGII